MASPSPPSPPSSPPPLVVPLDFPHERPPPLCVWEQSKATSPFPRMKRAQAPSALEGYGRPEFMAHPPPDISLEPSDKLLLRMGLLEINFAMQNDHLLPSEACRHVLHSVEHWREQIAVCEDAHQHGTAWRLFSIALDLGCPIEEEIMSYFSRHTGYPVPTDKKLQDLLFSPSYVAFTRGIPSAGPCSYPNPNDEWELRDLKINRWLMHWSSSYWIAHISICEKAEMYKLALELFELAFTIKCHPIEMLKDEFDRFVSRYRAQVSNHEGIVRRCMALSSTRSDSKKIKIW